MQSHFYWYKKNSPSSCVEKFKSNVSINAAINKKQPIDSNIYKNAFYDINNSRRKFSKQIVNFIKISLPVSLHMAFELKLKISSPK